MTLTRPCESKAVIVFPVLVLMGVDRVVGMIVRRGHDFILIV
jgi:hypothetical protein